MPAIAKLGAISIDCPDPVALSTFYKDVTGWDVIFESDDFVALSGPSMMLALHKVENFQRPTWPNAEIPKQMHLDFAVTDLDATEALLLEVGASRAEDQPNPTIWRVYLDPAGHPFCLTTMIPTKD